MFRTKVTETVETHFVLSNFFPAHRSDLEKYCAVGQATDDNMAHAH